MILFQPNFNVSVQRAKFEQHGNEYKQKRKASEVKGYHPSSSISIKIMFEV